MTSALFKIKAASIRGMVLSAGVLLVAAFALVARPVHADFILQGDSNSSTFSDLSCTTTCAQSSLASKIFTLGSTANGGHDSFLSIIGTSFSATGDVLGLPLAELNLVVGNKPGVGQTDVTFNYNLVLTFTIPGATKSQTFSMGISGNGAAGANGLVSVAGLVVALPDPLDLGGVILSNFRFGTVDPDSTFSDGVWEGAGQGTENTRVLKLLADVAYRPIAIPEPSTLALFGAGLTSLGLLSRRRKA